MNIYAIRKHHEKCLCVLELLNDAEKLLQRRKEQMKQWDANSFQWYSTPKKEMVDKVITANRVYCRIKRYYLNLIKTFEIN